MCVCVNTDSHCTSLLMDLSNIQYSVCVSAVHTWGSVCTINHSSWSEREIALQMNPNFITRAIAL